jgi:hypothetical protein
MIYSTEDPHFIFFLKPSLWRIPGVHDHFNRRQQRVGAASAKKVFVMPDVPDLIKCIGF